MSELSTVTEPSPKRTKTRSEKIKSALLNIVAAGFWIYAITKLFVFDIDVWIINLINPDLVNFLNYKFWALLILAATILATTRSRTVALKFLYVLSFPFIVLFWLLVGVGFFLWRKKSWLLVFAIINAAISFFQSFKRNFLLATTLITSAILIATFHNTPILLIAAALAFATVFIAYLFAFLKAFKPSAVFQAYSQAFPLIRKTDLFKFDDSFKNLPVDDLSADQLKIRTKEIQTVVLYNRVCFFAAKKLRDYQKSKLNTVAYVVSLVGLLIVTVFAFSLINFAAFKIDPLLFKFDYGPRAFFSFLYYSAGSMFYATNGIAPVALFSQAIQLAQFLFASFLFVIFFTVVLTMRNERYAADLNDTIIAIEAEGASMEGALKSNFNIDNIGKAIEALQDAEAELIGLILFITRGVGDDH